MTAPVLTVSKNSGGAATGAITCTWEDTIRLRLQSTAGVRSARFELYGYPPGWAAPSGWTEDTANRVIYATGVTPADFTLPTAASNDWGKWLLRAIVDGETDDGATALEILSPGGLHATPAGEGAQFGGEAEQWGKDLEENWRICEGVIAGAGAASYAPWRAQGVAGSASLDSTTWTTIGAVRVDPSALPAPGGMTVAYALHAELEVVEASAGTVQAGVRLLDASLTSLGSVSSTLSGATTFPEHKSVALTAGGSNGQVRPAATTYLLQLRRQGGSAGDRALCHNAYLEATWS